MNIINAVFTRNEATIRTLPVYQFDRGTILKISGLDLPQTFRADFANTETGPSKTVLGSDDAVHIPYEYFVSGATIHCWLVWTGADYKVTKKHIIMPVIRRGIETDEEPTPDEQGVIDQAIAKLNDAVAQTGQDVEAAAGCAEQAEQSAQAAATAKDAAVAAKADAEAAKDQAVQSAASVAGAEQRVSSLNATPLRGCSKIVEAVGIPVYVKAADFPTYAAYGLTDTGWYIFARIACPDGVTVTDETTVTGAKVIVTAGADHVDVAVRFEVAAQSQDVVISWGGSMETFVFRAVDLAVRNLDYRTTFYVYDLAPFVSWEYTLTTDAKFVAGDHYYTESGGVYTEAIEGTDWTADEDVPADTYYKHSMLHIEGMARNVTYQLDTPVDCPSEIVLPAIEEDGTGAWYEMRFRHTGSFSSTLLPSDPDVKVATEHTQAETAGMNMVDLHYMSIAGTKIWRFMNTHATIPTT